MTNMPANSTSSTLISYIILLELKLIEPNKARHNNNNNNNNNTQNILINVNI